MARSTCPLESAPTLSTAKAIHLTKGGPSQWIHGTFPGASEFVWRESYGAFSIGDAGIEATAAYIQNQSDHHRTRTLEEEFLRISQEAQHPL